MINIKNYCISYFDSSFSTNYMQNESYYMQLVKQGLGKIDKNSQFDVYAITLAYIALPDNDDLANLDTFVVNLNKLYKFNYLLVRIDDRERIEYSFNPGDINTYSKRVRY